MLNKILTAGVVATGLFLGGCSSDDDPVVESTIPVATPGTGNSVYDNIVNDSSLSTLLAAIDAAGLADTLDNEASEFTVFAPNNAAFQELEDSNPDDDAIADLIADPTTLSAILTYHVVAEFKLRCQLVCWGGACHFIGIVAAGELVTR